ncbi:helix-turn-helix transcriptional regulator [Pendulispora albinea]|uniref:AraC family transcriptional regulator n=1 Tax=Pendulispora albinea TaxID=2741071 RepID=A0ABZ2LRP6_9BACT
MGESDAPLPISRRELGNEGAVRVFAYRCTAHRGDRPEPERFDKPVISIVQSGVFGFRSERPTQLLTRGFLLLGNPGRGYEVSHEHGGGDECITFRFEEAALDELAGGRARNGDDGWGYFSRSVLPPVPRADVIRHLTEARLLGGAPSLGLEELAFALAACVLGETGVRRPPKIPPDSRRARDSVHAALALLDQSSSEDLHLEDIAHEVGLSPYHFLRLFKRELGVTPYRYLLQARVRRAVELLGGTDRPVTEIAFDVGFGDLSNFINAFRREVGCSPGQFRRYLRGAKMPAGLARLLLGPTR